MTDLGFGLGLRREHYEDAASGTCRSDFFEAISENFMACGGRPLDYLLRIRRERPLVLHGVSLSIGAAEDLDERYLDDLAELIHVVEPAWVSDHLCWTGVAGVNTHDLLPLPYTEESLAVVAERVLRVQERLGRRIALENVSAYLSWATSAIPEWEYLNALAERADCWLLLDVNNVHVTARNQGFAAERYVDAIAPQRVRQIHLAGHSDHGTHVVDTHDAPVADAVWELYRRAVARLGPVATSLERDDDIPPLGLLEDELERARHIVCEVRREAAA